MNQLFISYSRKDTEIARRLTDRFTAQGLNVWVDWQDIPPSVDWIKEIQKGIEEADIFLFLISPDSVASQICKDEIAHASINAKRWPEFKLPTPSSASAGSTPSRFSRLGASV